MIDKKYLGLASRIDLENAVFEAVGGIEKLRNRLSKLTSLDPEPFEYLADSVIIELNEILNKVSTSINKEESDV